VYLFFTKNFPRKMWMVQVVEAPRQLLSLPIPKSGPGKKTCSREKNMKGCLQCSRLFYKSEGCITERSILASSDCV